jgi:hypothetical protein
VRLELDENLVDNIADASDPAQAFTVEAGLLDLAASVSSGQGFDRLRHPVLQEVSRRLEGREIFPECGPVYRIIRSRSSGNEVQFQTWPQVAKSGGLYSMVASLTLESMPYVARPVLVVRASRRRWLEKMPDAAKLRRQRSITGYLMGRTGAPLSVEFTANVRAGTAEEPCSPDFMHQGALCHPD